MDEFRHSIPDRQTPELEVKSGGASLTGSLCLSSPLVAGRGEGAITVVNALSPRHAPLKNPTLLFRFSARETRKPTRRSLSATANPTFTAPWL